MPTALSPLNSRHKVVAPDVHTPGYAWLLPDRPPAAPTPWLPAVAGVDAAACQEALAEVQRAGAVLLQGEELLEAWAAAASGSSGKAAAAGSGNTAAAGSSNKAAVAGSGNRAAAAGSGNKAAAASEGQAAAVAGSGRAAAGATRRQAPAAGPEE